MIMGRHRAACSFMKAHRRALQRIPLAVSVTVVSLTQPAGRAGDGVPVFVDAGLPKPPARAGRLSLHEHYSQLRRYVRFILAAARPISVGSSPGALRMVG